MDSVIATVSGYHGSERFKLIKMIAKTGANYVGAMSLSVTHLVCQKFEGKKYVLAKKFNKIIVNHHWVEECLKQGRRVAEHPYMSQSNIGLGPSQFETPVLNRSPSQLKSHKSLLSSCNILIEDENRSSDRDDPDSDQVVWTGSSLVDEIKNCQKNTRRLRSKRHKQMDKTPKKKHKKPRRYDPDPLSDIIFCSDHEELHTSSSPESKSKTKFPLDMSESTSPYCYNGEQNQENKDECEDLLAGYVSDSDKEDSNCNTSSPPSLELSCVICWAEFSPTRGILPCGHRFCYSCIRDWSNHMATRGMSSNCPLCKTRFTSIIKVEDAASNDQKIYSQTIPVPRSSEENFLPSSRERLLHDHQPPFSVCHACRLSEPEDLLIYCHICRVRCIHSYCLDPLLLPWTCACCKDLQLMYHHHSL